MCKHVGTMRVSVEKEIYNPQLWRSAATPTAEPLEDRMQGNRDTVIDGQRSDCGVSCDYKNSCELLGMECVVYLADQGEETKECKREKA